MKRPPRPKHGPEFKIQTDLREFLAYRGWLVERTHGNKFQTGFPDLFIAHREHGSRWIDCKVSGQYSFTRAQREKWPKWEAASVGIWILCGATQADYDLLFQPPNWRAYWKAIWDTRPDVDELLAACEQPLTTPLV